MRFTEEDYYSGLCSESEVGTLKLPAPETTNDQPSPPTIPYDPTNPLEVLAFDAIDSAKDIAALEGAARQGDIQAIRTRTSIRERRAKLLGIDAPKEVALQITRKEPTNVREMTTAELQELAASAKLIEGESHRVED